MREGGEEPACVVENRGAEGGGLQRGRVGAQGTVCPVRDPEWWG